jgi:hypothetical protein
MRPCATEGPHLPALLALAVPLLQKAQELCPRTGPGAKPKVPDWLIGALIMLAVMHRKKSKSAQFRFLSQPTIRGLLAAAVAEHGWPTRSMFFRRYRRSSYLLQAAVRLQGERAVAEGTADPKLIAADKSLVPAKGPPWHQRDRKAGKEPRGVDRDARWGYSEYHGWVYGYSFEVVVTATRGSTVFPLLASADVASAAEVRSFAGKVGQLPAATEAVACDSGYDANALGERVEYDTGGRRTGRRFLCPENPRHNKRPKSKPGNADAARARSRERRRRRRRFLEGRIGRRLYKRRSKTVEPFNAWFKAFAEVEERAWHRGLGNNQAQLLAAIFAYQLLVRYNFQQGNRSSRIRWIIDAL